MKYSDKIVCIRAARFLWLIPMIFSILFSGFAQSENKLLRDGNLSYKKGEFEKATDNYNKALQKNEKNKDIAAYNMGTAMYKQKQYDTAAYYFNQALATTDDKEIKSKAFHNLGNSYLQTRKLEKSVDAYKNALKLNPKDEDTRYNLAYAQKLMQRQQQQQQQNKDNKNNQDKNEQNKDQQKQNENKDNKDKKQNEQNNENKKDDKQKSQESQTNKGLSKEEAEKLLNALMNKEKELQNKRKNAKTGTVVQPEKDW
jgi:tetratricopeptide (TPR) repeat protein